MVEVREIPFKRYRLLLLILILFTAVYRIYYIEWGPLDLAPDEAHYWEWSRRLSLSYYSKGPAIAYIIVLFTAFFGDSELGVRIGAVFISSFLTLIIYIFAKKLFNNERTAFFAALLPQVTPLFAAGSILMTTDSPLLLFWGLTLYTFYMAVEYKRALYWLLSGIFIGLGLLTKYTMALVYPSLFLFLLISKGDRWWLRKREPYLMLSLSLLILVPVILWNFENGWVGFKHIVGQTHLSEGLRLSIEDFLEFFGSQVAILSPFIFLGLLYSMFKMGLDGLKGRREYLFLFLTSTPILLFFLLKSLQGKVQANWAAPAYFTGLIAVVVVFDNMYSKGLRGIPSTIFVSLFLGLFLTILSHYPNIINHIGIDLPSKKDPTTRLKGWEELGGEVGVIYKGMQNEGKVFIISDRYQIASELAFYVPGHPITYNVNLGRRMNQYDLWEGFNSLKGWNAIYVKWDGDPLKERWRRAFRECENNPPLKINRDGRVLREFYMYQCYDFKGMEPSKIEKW